MAATSQILEIVTLAHGLATGDPSTRPIVNVYHFRRGSGLFAPAAKSAIATAFTSAIADPLKAIMSVSYVTDYLDIRWIDDPLDPYSRSALSADGELTGDSLANFAAITLRLITGVRGRSNMGSKHYGPVAESAATLNHLTSGSITSWTSFASALLGGFSAGGESYTPVLVSRKNSVLSSTVAEVAWQPVNEITVNTVLGTMRRRRTR